MAEMTAEEAINYLRCITEYKGKDVVILLEEHADKIASLIAAQAAEIAKQQRMVRSACAELAKRAGCNRFIKQCKMICVNKECEACWLKWLTEQAEEK